MSLMGTREQEILKIPVSLKEDALSHLLSLFLFSIA